jgi:hypothetical protein
VKHQLQQPSPSVFDTPVAYPNHSQQNRTRLSLSHSQLPLSHHTHHLRMVQGHLPWLLESCGCTVCTTRYAAGKPNCCVAAIKLYIACESVIVVMQ